MNTAGEIAGFLIAGLLGCFWIRLVGKLILFNWADKREKRERREAIIRRLLTGHCDEDTINWLIYGEMGKPNGPISFIAEAVANRVHRWKEWSSRDEHYPDLGPFF